jgi:putative glutamine amidotransferase
LSTTVSQSRVVVSFSQDGKDAPAAFREELGEAADRVSALLEARGLAVEIVNAANPDTSAKAALAGADALVVLGGADIDPACYGETLEADNLYYVDTAADRFEIDLVQHAREADMPVFGICRGSQIINVAFGGSLVQDLGEGLHNREVIGDPWTDHAIEIETDTLLKGIVQQPQIVVRTGHHQAVNRLGDGLRVAARAEDGVIEATEATEGWVLGVQWHPEEAQGDPLMLERYFDDFARAATRS